MLFLLKQLFIFLAACFRRAAAQLEISMLKACKTVGVPLCVQISSTRNLGEVFYSCLKICYNLYSSGKFI